MPAFIKVRVWHTKMTGFCQPRPEFLSLGPTDLQGQILLCVGACAVEEAEQHPWPLPAGSQHLSRCGPQKCLQKLPTSPEDKSTPN